MGRLGLDTVKEAATDGDRSRTGGGRRDAGRHSGSDGRARGREFRREGSSRLATGAGAGDGASRNGHGTGHEEYASTRMSANAANRGIGAGPSGTERLLEQLDRLGVTLLGDEEVGPLA
jgi:hypothetical protein